MEVKYFRELFEVSILIGLWVLFGITILMVVHYRLRSQEARRDADYWHKRCLYEETDHHENWPHPVSSISVREGQIDIPNVPPLLSIETTSDWDRSMLVFSDIWHLGSRNSMPNPWVRFWHRVLLGWRWESCTPKSDTEELTHEG